MVIIGLKEEIYRLWLQLQLLDKTCQVSEFCAMKISSEALKNK